MLILFLVCSLQLLRTKQIKNSKQNRISRCDCASQTDSAHCSQNDFQKNGKQLHYVSDWSRGQYMFRYRSSVLSIYIMKNTAFLNSHTFDICLLIVLML